MKATGTANSYLAIRATGPSTLGAESGATVRVDKAIQSLLNGVTATPPNTNHRKLLKPLATLGVGDHDDVGDRKASLSSGNLERTTKLYVGLEFASDMVAVQIVTSLIRGGSLPPHFDKGEANQ